MSAAPGFFLFFGTTVVLLALVVFTGLRELRRLHIGSVVLMLAALGVTIVFAKRLGDEYDLEAAGIITPIHLTLAKITTAGYLLPIATGIRTIFRPEGRKLHGRVAWTLVGLTLLSAATGFTMLLLAERVAA